MRRVILTIGMVAGLLAPFAGHAMQAETYDLRAGLVNARWEGKGTIAMQQEQNGILLTATSGTGIFLTTGLPNFSAEAASISIAASRDTSARFVWTHDGGKLSSIAFGVPAGTTLPVSFSLRQNAEWTSARLEGIGILIPPGGSLLLNSIDLVRWSVFEKIGEAATSFFIFDQYRPYSINFVWGPVIALNPIEAHSVFRDLPPQQIYATFALNVALLTALLLLILWAQWKKAPGSRRTFVLRSFTLLALTAWILMDLRMGSEFFSWVASDQSQYIAANTETRTFRDRDRFYDFAEFVKPYLYDRGSYAFFAQQAWPYLGNMRYLTYPAIPGINIDQDDTWVVYDRPDMSVSDAGQVTIDGEAVSEPGRILGRFDDGSFVFRTTTPPARQ